MEKRTQSFATKIVNDILESGNYEFWHTYDGEPYISMTYEDGHVEHTPLKSKVIRDQLSNNYYQKTGDAINGSAITSAISVLKAEARSGKSYRMCIRIGGVDGAIYLDLGNDTYDAVKITADGWQITNEVPVKFRRTKGMLPLPEPIRGGSLDEDLKPLLTVDTDEEDSWLLIKAWLLGLLLPEGPHPILAFRGEQDTAKSYTQKVIRDIVDPNTLKNRRPAKTVENLMIAASNNWVVSFDNMSKISDDLSDDLCCIATGGGIAKRTQYTNADETILEVCRPVVMNGIENVITRPDLLDRSIIITLSQIPTERRTPEAKLLAEFNEKMPKILGALLDCAVIAMGKQNEITLNDPYRMAGFVKFAAAGLGNEGEKFQAAYKNNRAYAVAESISDMYLVNRIQETVHQYCYNQICFSRPDPCFRGNASKFLDFLRKNTNGVGDISDHHKALLPKTPQSLSGSLRRLSPALHLVNISAKQVKRSTEDNTIQWEIRDTKLKPTNEKCG